MSLPYILVSLMTIPRVGTQQINVRLRTEDKSMVNRAAQRLGMHQAEFLRVALINTARAIVDEFEKEPPKPDV